MRLEAERAGQRRAPHASHLTGQPIAPGQRTLTSYLEPRAPGRRASAPAWIEDELAAAEWDALAADRGIDAAAWPDEERQEARARNVVGLRAAWPAQHGQMDGNARLRRQAETRTPARMIAAAGPRRAAVDEPVPAVARQQALRLEGGQPLPETVRRMLEQRFGRSLAGVRIHTDATAQAAASALGVRAFTVGQHIFFGSGQLALDTPEGMELLAHEDAPRKRIAPRPRSSRPAWRPARRRSGRPA